MTHSVSAHAQVSLPATPTVATLGVRVSTLTLEESARRIVEQARPEVDAASEPEYVCATSVHGLIVGSRDVEFRRVLNSAWIVTPDGMPLVWFGRLRGRSSMERVYGPALMKRVCELSAGTGIKHFLYGGAEGVAGELAAHLEAEIPGLDIAGMYTPPFRPLTEPELEHVADTINASGAHIVWVGLSTPKQERWIRTIRDRLQVRVLLSVGAAFDFHAKRLRQAPAVLQRNGLEWAYRLLQEPRRLWRRYAYNNPRFIYLAILQLTGLRTLSIDRDESRSVSRGPSTTFS